jgi:hypothetical protein
MSTVTAGPIVSPEEEAQSIAEYRHMGFDKNVPTHVVYPPPHRNCPWGCGYQIGAIAFNLERFPDTKRYREAFWLGPGLLAPCPGCGKLVLFGMLEKRTVADKANVDAPLLPDRWFDVSQLLPRSQR